MQGRACARHRPGILRLELAATQYGTLLRSYFAGLKAILEYNIAAGGLMLHRLQLPGGDRSRMHRA